jgi:hypothetical protein
MEAGNSFLGFEGRGDSEIGGGKDKRKVTHAHAREKMKL